MNMKIEKCSQGHFYDGEKYERCPFCKENAVQRVPLSENTSLEKFSSKENSTIMEFESDKLMTHRFVTGWLVCVEGPEKGRDYRLRFGFNQIGRSHEMNVCIFEDDGISRGIHCSVVYENRKNVFILVPGNGTLTYKEDMLLESPVSLKSGDRFRIGETVLEFIAFCREGVTWEEK